MKKAIKRIAMLFVVCGLAVSVSFGVDLYGNEEHYQKLKAEVEEYGDVGKCKWDENGKRIISKDVNGRVCEFQNIIAFFDEIKAMKVEKNELQVAINKVKEMPRFKNDSRIYSKAKGAYFQEKAFWDSVWYDWESAKNKMEMDGARRGYWKKLAE